jgi:AraC family transcriptional regulator, regulatory protein of adaptative response / DNA-3-methyladenine glycosylase II
MKPDAKSCYKALIARDSRFDGLFFVGVTSTGIYCRPICPVKPPKEINCRFYDTAQEAEQAGFRPCLRCRPELAPGNAPVDDSQRIAHLVVQRIEEGVTDERSALEAMAGEFELSSRQIRRIIRKELGVAPIQLLLTRRLLLAKQLLTETRLPIIDIAFASGFASLRRFNDAFSTRYGMPPTRLRKRAGEDTGSIKDPGTSNLQLSYRPPYDWPGILTFLKARELKGVEWVTGNFYARTVHLGDSKGWIKITQVEKKNALMLEFTHSLTPVLPALLNRVRALFDLNARPEKISKHLTRDKVLAPMVKANPGMRVPGAFNGFELGLRAILGQQVTVKSATTIAGRLAASFGEAVVTPFIELNRLTPAPGRIARTGADKLAKLGIINTRCQSILALAQAHISGRLSLDSGSHHNPEATIERLAELPGIGQWTANYIAMRALRWPDAFPKEDIAVRNNLGGVTAKQAEEMSQAWRPWRSYAVLHIWRNPSPPAKKAIPKEVPAKRR